MSFGTELLNAFDLISSNQNRPQREPNTHQAYEQFQKTQQHDEVQQSQTKTKPQQNHFVVKSQPIQQRPVMERFATEESNYIDKLGSKRRDVLKILSFALTILLAISIHYFIDHWMKDFATAYNLTFKQELALKLLYPLLIIFVLWNLKLITSK